MSSSTDSNSTKDILYINFNQTVQSLMVGSKTGFTLYDLQTVYECKPTFESRELVDVCIVERNFCSSLVAYVLLDKPRTLSLVHCGKGEKIKEKLFPNTILCVKLNRHNVVVCLEDRIFILYVQNIVNGYVHVITNTVPNLRGLVALTWGNIPGQSLLAYPGSSQSGDVQIFDAMNKHAKITIPAHTSQLAALAFDEAEERLATASIKGTVIRVFSVLDGKILFEFRRGVKRCAEINCLSFSRHLNLLCVSSNTETIHIFKLDTPESTETSEEDSEGWMEMFGRVLTQSAKYLPSQMSDVFTQQRAFAYVHLPFTEQKTICGITDMERGFYVLVASLEGFLYIYNINTELGGQCHLVKQYRLEGPRLCFIPEPTTTLRRSFSIDTKLMQNSDCDTTDATHPDSPRADDYTKAVGQLSCLDILVLEQYGGGCSSSNSNGVHLLDYDASPPLLTPVDP